MTASGGGGTLTNIKLPNHIDHSNCDRQIVSHLKIIILAQIIQCIYLKNYLKDKFIIQYIEIITNGKQLGYYNDSRKNHDNSNNHLDDDPQCSYPVCHKSQSDYLGLYRE